METDSAAVSTGLRDSYVEDPFYPLEQASCEILTALRRDEASPDADLFRKIAHCSNSYESNSSSSSTSTANGVGVSATAGTSLLQRQGFEYRVTPTTAAFLTAHSPAAASTTTSSSATATGTALSTAGHIHRNIQHVKSIPLPHHLAQTLATDTQLVSLMGTFPDARLVWVTVDNTLYIWEYETNIHSTNDRQDFVAFTVPTGQVIVSVGLVPPKQGMCLFVCSSLFLSLADLDTWILLYITIRLFLYIIFMNPFLSGVFKQVVEWCIVVTTPQEVILCALARSSSDSSNRTATSNYDSVLRLIPTSYIIPTDSIPILSVQGTKDGRIFLGGYDGCLYEMAYEGHLNPSSETSSTATSVKVHMNPTFHVPSHLQESMEEDDQDVDFTNRSAVWSETMRLTTAFVAGTKRAFSSLALGPTTPSTHDSRPRKCRKINHTSLTPSIVQALVPNFIIRVATSALSFATSSSNYTVSHAGPIIQLVMDHHRKILYALTQKGFVHAFHIPSSSSSSPPPPSTTVPSSTPLIRYACTVDLPKSAHRYLENVARGRPFPPSRPFTGDSDTFASIIYPGGASAASAGVGGMDNARFLLKLADQQGQDGSSSRAAGTTSKDRAKNTSHGILHPISIHSVPPSSSSSLTLVAVTSGGLRYYLSVLPDIGNSFNMSDSLSNGDVHGLGQRFTLAHIRSPPPVHVPRKGEEFQDLSLDLNSQVDTELDTKGLLHKYMNGSIQPGQSRSGTLNTSVTRALYWNGLTWLAVNHRRDWRDDASVEPFGDSIITLIPDTTLRTPANLGSHTNQLVSGSGLAEIISFPTIECRSNAQESSVLGGGYIWDFSCSSTDFDDQAFSTYLSVHRLITHSRTPSDTELSTGMISPFIAPSRPRPLPKDDTSTQLSFSRVKSSFDSVMVSKDNSRSSPQPFTSGIPHSESLLFSSIGLLTRQFLRRFSNFPKPGTPEVDRVMVSLRKYRIHQNTGCSDVGFTIPKIASKPKTLSRVNKTNMPAPIIISERLSPWLVNPREATLCDASLQHPALSWYKPHFVALNSGGVHIFSESSPSDQLRDLLATTNIALLGKDEKVQSYFFNYGFLEACIMCLSIAITADSDEVKGKAIHAALNYAHRPTMARALSTSWTDGTSGMQPSSDLGNLTYQPSYLYQALIVFSSRLLRPIWYKPAIVVTEGREITSKNSKSTSKVAPTKVEFLLDEITLQEIRQSLVNLQNIIEVIFSPVIAMVPESPMSLYTERSSMNIDPSTDDEGNRVKLLTKAMQFRAKALTREAGPQTFSDGLIMQIAKRTEERNIHSLYRLLSRTAQVLSLVTHLHRAHFTPELPDVEFGLLHGMCILMHFQNP